MLQAGPLNEDREVKGGQGHAVSGSHIEGVGHAVSERLCGKWGSMQRACEGAMQQGWELRASRGLCSEHPQSPEADPTESNLVTITWSLTQFCPGHLLGLEDIPGSKC